MDDTNAIATVKRLRHRTDGGRHECECGECSSVVRVCVLASEAIAMKAAKGKANILTPEEASALLNVLYTLNPQIPGMEQSIDRKLRLLSALPGMRFSDIRERVNSLPDLPPRSTEAV